MNRCEVKEISPFHSGAQTRCCTLRCINVAAFFTAKTRQEISHSNIKECYLLFEVVLMTRRKTSEMLVVNKYDKKKYE